MNDYAPMPVPFKLNSKGLCMENSVLMVILFRLLPAAAPFTGFGSNPYFAVVAAHAVREKMGRIAHNLTWHGIFRGPGCGTRQFGRGLVEL